MGWDGDLREASRLSRRLAQAGAASAGCLLARQLLVLTRSSPAASIRNTASPQARAWSSRASRCRRAAASTASASPIRSPARTYTPEENSRYRNEGLASWYGDDFHGRLTANGEIYDMERDLGRASDPADAELCARHQSLDPQIADRARERSRPLSRATARSTVGARPPTCSASAITARRACASNMSARRRSRAPTTASWSRPCAKAQPAPAPVRDGRVEPLPAEFRPCARDPRRRAAAAGAAVRSRRSARIASREAYPQRSQRRDDAACERSARAPSGRPALADISPDTEPPRADGRTPACARKRARCAQPRYPRIARAARGRQQPPPSSPVTAYAPVRQDGALAVASGRGLY